MCLIFKYHLFLKITLIIDLNQYEVNPRRRNSKQMVVLESEIMSPGEVESPLQSEQHRSRNNVHNAPTPQLGRQSSIYSLTLDEFQHTLNESGKNFGSMNMDEFLNSIWTAEENQAHGQVHTPSAPATSAAANTTTTTSAAMTPNGAACSSAQLLVGINSSSGEPNMIVRQLSLSRQGSLTLPGPLSRKTVDEVWSEIQKTQHEHQQPSNGNDSSNDRVPGSAQRQPTYGEMTLEDFLVKAGVVRETNHPNAPSVQQQVPPAFGLYPNGNNRIIGPPPGSAHMVRPMMGLGAGVGPPAISSYVPGYPACYGGMVGNGGYGQGLGIGSPASPVSSDGMAASQLDSGNQYGLDMGGIRSNRKRIIDGPVEKVVERRQRRMIKNRESAARSRARKQAYTVELEAELNMLKEENTQLKHALAEIERKRKQQFYEEMRMKSVSKSYKAKEKSRVLRRTSSCPI